MRQMLFIVMTAFLCSFGTAHASGGGKSEGGGLYAHLEAFTVNLSSSNQFLRLEITLKVNSDPVTEKIKTNSAVVRHEMIMLLTGKTAEQLSTLEGKKELIQETIKAVNQALELKKEKVVDVLIDSLLIQ